MFDIQLVVENAPPEYDRFAGEVRVDFVIDPGHRHPGLTADLASFGFARKGAEALPTACRSYTGCGQILKPVFHARMRTGSMLHRLVTGREARGPGTGVI